MRSEKSLTQNLFDLINGFKLENEFDEMKLPDAQRHALALEVRPATAKKRH